MLDCESGRALIKKRVGGRLRGSQGTYGRRSLGRDALEELERLREGFAKYYPSMAQDVPIHQRQTEVELLNGAHIEEATAASSVSPPPSTGR